MWEMELVTAYDNYRTLFIKYCELWADDEYVVRYRVMVCLLLNLLEGLIAWKLASLDVK